MELIYKASNIIYLAPEVPTGVPHIVRSPLSEVLEVLCPIYFYEFPGSLLDLVDFGGSPLMN